MGRPCCVCLRKVTEATTFCGIDYATASKPITYLPRDLRLNIYSATFSATDYTDLVHQAYISQTRQDPPKDTRNCWLFKPTSDESGTPSYFGRDPMSGRSKVCVVIYRIANCVGQTDGFISVPDDPAPWDLAYKQLTAIHTTKYPVSKNITGFRFAAVCGDDTMTLNSMTENLAQTLNLPYPYPSPYIAAAVWATRIVTAFVANAVNSVPTNRNIGVNVGVGGMG